MRKEFETYVRETNRDGSNKAGSYVRALQSVNRIIAAGLLPQFEIDDVYEVTDIATLKALHRHLLDEGQNPGNVMLKAIPGTTSHLLGRFSAAAVSMLIGFLENETVECEILAKCDAANDAREASQLIARAPKAERMFRRVVLANYNNQCCLTKLNVPETLEACVIDPGARNSMTSPDNGLCLSATYAAAFNAHLITFDEGLRMVISPMLAETTTSSVFRSVFRVYERTRIATPLHFRPLERHLAHHRELLVK